MLNKFLEIVIAVMILAIIAVTTVVVMEDKGKVEAENKFLKNISEGKENTVDAFTRLGQLRIRTISEDNITEVVLVTPWFSYPQGDKILYEELCEKQLELRNLITDYIAGFTMTDLRSKGEMSVKEELLDLINSRLVMGKIRAVYFDQYIFMD